MIITTNLKLSELKNPPDLAHARIYDRILERCAPCLLYTSWNSVEQIEKARDSQLAREIEAALPRELSREQQLALVRAYVKEDVYKRQGYMWIGGR